MTEREKKAFDLGYRAGHRTGRIEARAELTAIYRGRILDATTILSAPIPKAPTEPVQEKK